MESKPRKLWIAGLLTILIIGLGHLYSGRVQKGVFLYIGQYVALMVCVILILIFPSLLVLAACVVLGVAYFIYSIVDSVLCAKGTKPTYHLKKYNRWYVYLGIFFVCSFIVQPAVSHTIKTYWAQAYKIPSGAMKPTLMPGDHILVRKGLAVKDGVQKGDIVVFPYPEDPSKSFIKRVIGLGGQRIEVKEKNVIINNEIIGEPYKIHMDSRDIPEHHSTRDNMPSVVIPDDSVFLMGDNRDNSHDSRFWGTVKKSSIAGKAAVVYWSWDKESFKIRWDRIGQTVD